MLSALHHVSTPPEINGIENEGASHMLAPRLGLHRRTSTLYMTHLPADKTIESFLIH